MRPATPDAYRLMHEGALALADAEARGIRIDTAYLEGAITKAAAGIREMEERLKSHDIFRTWRKLYGSEANLGSRDQLGQVLFGHVGLKYPKDQPPEKNGKRRYVADEAVLGNLKHPFTDLYLELAKQQKLHGTYLKGVAKHVVDGYLHPSFNLHLVVTFRSSGSDPNFQNIPIRDAVIGREIRSAFIPRDGHVLLEIDYKAAEVRIAACYHKDPVMLEYIASDYDLHRDMAMECYKLRASQITKKIRNTAKGMFVFAAFYGDYYRQISQNLWNAALHEQLMIADGTLLIDHLRANGIDGPGLFDSRQEPRRGTFEHHIKEVEDDFWGRRFCIYDQWRRDWYEAYKRHGGIRMKTGFVSQGLFKRNEIINAPVQGSAFHCLLWSFIELNKRLKAKRMQSMVIGQIHDSIILDCHKDELGDVLAMAKAVMTRDLRAAWPWIITGMDIEAEASDTNWFEKKVVEIPQ